MTKARWLILLILNCLGFLVAGVMILGAALAKQPPMVGATHADFIEKLQKINDVEGLRRTAIQDDEMIRSLVEGVGAQRTLAYSAGIILSSFALFNIALIWKQPG